MGRPALASSFAAWRQEAEANLREAQAHRWQEQLLHSEQQRIALEAQLALTKLELGAATEAAEDTRSKLKERLAIEESEHQQLAGQLEVERQKRAEQLMAIAARRMQQYGVARALACWVEVHIWQRRRKRLLLVVGGRTEVGSSPWRSFADRTPRAGGDPRSARAPP